VPIAGGFFCAEFRRRACAKKNIDAVSHARGGGLSLSNENITHILNIIDTIDTNTYLVT
jgi:hypothetical protein